MNWLDEWKALSLRIDGYLHAVSIYLDTLKVERNPISKTNQFLTSQAQEIILLIERYHQAHKADISSGANSALNRFLQEFSQIFHDGTDLKIESFKYRAPNLAAFRYELDYHLSDFQFITTRRVERAFMHLQYSIIANPSVRQTWKKAFENREEDCERLGAAHLLWHGIYAFKANATGGRSDLILGHTVDDATRVAEVADSLVLTEWKAVRDSKDAKKIAEQAQKQIEAYTCGPLAGLEFTRYRYVVLVSQKQIITLPEVQFQNAICRNVNVAVDPDPPSVVARKKNGI